MPSRNSAPKPADAATTAAASHADERAAAHRMLNEVQVRTLTTLSRASRWRMARCGEFPKPIKISTGRIAWRESEVLTWLASKTETAA